MMVARMAKRSSSPCDPHHEIDGQTSTEHGEIDWGFWPAPGTGDNVQRQTVSRVSTDDQKTASLHIRTRRGCADKYGRGMAVQIKEVVSGLWNGNFVKKLSLLRGA
jgi:hypothetical protein